MKPRELAHPETPPVNDNDIERERIAQHVEAFLAKGGAIQVIDSNCNAGATSHIRRTAKQQLIHNKPILL